MDQHLERILLEGRVGSDVSGHYRLDEADIHFQFRRAPLQNVPLIIRFHGAVQRDKRQLPAFQANLKTFNDHAHQLSICDPTMMAREGFSCSWYAGAEGLPVQSILTKFINQVKSILTPTRTVYLGSSGGGFAAMFHSYHDPASVAVVMVPQTNLARHFLPASVQRYIENCWPGQTLEAASQQACLDLPALYAKGYENTIIYVQSAGDFRHNNNQLLPMLNACLTSGDPRRDRLILASDYWGRPGHGGSVPAEGYLPWVRAALASPTHEVEDLLAAFGGARQPSIDAPAPRQRSDSNPNRFASSDLRQAEILTTVLKSTKHSEEQIRA